MRPTLARVTAALAAAVLAAVGLTSCSTAASGGCTPLASSGDGSASVQVTGAFGAIPTVSFGRPLHVQQTEVSTVIAGSGAPITAPQQIVADITFLDGTTGAVATRSSYAGDDAAARFVVGNVPLPGLRKALQCARVGERLAAVIPPGQGIPAASRPSAIGATDSIVAVVDVRRSYLARADGTNQVMGSGLPAVVLGPDGRPGITLPEGSPPSTVQVANLKDGSGAQLKRGDTALIAWTAVSWKPGDPADGTVASSTWADGTPRIVKVQDGQTLKGLVRALTGQRVGSQVLAILPPSSTTSDERSGAPTGATLVYVIDVLGKA